MGNNYSRFPGQAEDWRSLDSRVDRFPNIDADLTQDWYKATIRKRAVLKNQLDDFCTFSWNGVNAFDTFGAFITNKNSLKFYNGPGYSNQYSSPMFTDAAGVLTGMKFNVQKISFTIGVYWISEEHYRYLIHWLNPYEIGLLSFDFEPYWGYKVKLAGIKDSTRTIIGYEQGTPDTRYEEEFLTSFEDKFLYEDGQDVVLITQTDTAQGVYRHHEPRYYTELTLDFEVQGEPCAMYLLPYTWNSAYNTQTWDSLNNTLWAAGPSEIDDNNSITYSYDTYLPVINETVANTINSHSGYNENGATPDSYTTPVKLSGNVKSDLPTGFKNTIHFKLASVDDSSDDILELDDDASLDLALYARYYPDGIGTENYQEVLLYQVSLWHLSYLYENSEDISFNLSYNSEDGLLFWSYGDEEKLLTKLSMVASGDRIVKTMHTIQFRMPGVLDNPNFQFQNFSLHLTAGGDILKYFNFDQNSTDDNENYGIIQAGDSSDMIMYAKTNLI